MSELYTQFDSTFFEKTRLSMLTIIYKEEKVSFNQLKSRLQGTDGSIYSHLEKLVKAGYVFKKKEIVGLLNTPGIQTVYGITKEGSRVFREYLGFLENQISTMKE